MTRQLTLRFLLLTLLINSALVATAQTIRYVSPSGTNTNPTTATSWASSTTNLQGAINASASGDQVWVRAGTFRPTTTTGPDSRTISFAMRNGVAIYGGFAGTETTLNQRPAINLTSPSGTTLSGDIGTPGNTTDNSYHVITNPAGLTTTAILDGFVITGGNANITGFPTNSGGAMLNRASVSGTVCSPLIRNCRFEANTGRFGGAIYNEGSSGGNSSPRIETSLFVSNTAIVTGGAIFSSSPGGTSSALIINCGFQLNTSAGQAGALYNFATSAGTCIPRLINCSFQNNSAVASGGAVMYNDGNGGTCTPVVSNCVLFGNGGANTFVNVNGATVVGRYSWLETSVTGYGTASTNLTGTTNPFASTTSLLPATGAPTTNVGDPVLTVADIGNRDLAGRSRFVGTQIDMGAVESCASLARLYVRVGASGARTGASWTDAITDLQTGLDYVCDTAPSEIWVSTGTYKPTTGTDRTISFSMRNGLSLYGGFTGTETTLSQRPTIGISTPSSTTLSGDIGTVGNTADNSYHVISNPAGLTTTATLDGFVITGGNANNNSDFLANRGGGVWNISSSPTFRNCLFQANNAVNGGAMNNYGVGSGNRSSPVLINCAFQSNTSSFGGGMYNDGSSGGISSPSLTNCSFQGNTASNSGGGMYNEGINAGNSSPSLTNCSFQGNTVSSTGGAMYNYGSAGNSSPTLTNCVLFGNGGVNTFANSDATMTASYSLFDDTVTSYTNVTGNLTTTTSPFVSANSVVLSTTATAINAGNPATTVAAVGNRDLAGRSRFVGTRIDMGAVESCASIARLYVRVGASGARTGTSWTDAITDLQAGLDYVCGTTPSEIWVSTGTYKPGTDRTISFAMRNGLAIYGGFTGTESTLSQRSLTYPSSTTLSGDIGTAGNTADNSYHVISNPAGLTTTAILDGFVITGGNANIDSDFFANRGGGVWNVSSSPTFRNCLFQANNATNGGAMNNYGYGSGNRSSPVLINCAFQGNTAVYGGAMYNDGNAGGSSPSLTNCSFQANTASTSGGGLYNDGSSGGSSNPSLTNCVLFGNGGVNTVVNSGATVTARYCLFDNPTNVNISGPGNLTTTTSPFVSANSVVLSTTATAINAGDPVTTVAAVGNRDLAGRSRFVGTRIDMGAVESCASIARLYVRVGTSGARTGTSWADAITDLQTGIDYVCDTAPSEIWVSTGIYKPTTGTDLTISFAMRPNVAIYGGFAGTESTLSQRPAINLTTPSATTLSGEIGNPASTDDNSYHVISNPAGLTTTAILDGFLIMGGNANGSTDLDQSGGGLLNNGSGSGRFCSPTIRNCTFVNNRARYGGAIENQGDGGGISSPILTNCSFQSNTSSVYGGAMYNYGSNAGGSSPILTNCSFQGNTAILGGAMYNFGGNSGISSPILTNCSFQSNNASDSGGAMYNQGYSGSSSPSLTNCVLFGNGGTNTVVNVNGATVTARFSLFDASVTGYTNVTGSLTATTSPFASTATTRLRIGSPAINAADPTITSATVGSTDLAGLPRFVGTLDMGALEFQNEIFTVKTGNWSDPTVWNVNRLPQLGDRARLKHAVTLPASYAAFVSRLLYDSAGRLLYGTGGRLRIEP